MFYLVDELKKIVFQWYISHTRKERCFVYWIEFHFKRATKTNIRITHMTLWVQNCVQVWDTGNQYVRRKLVILGETSMQIILYRLHTHKHAGAYVDDGICHTWKGKKEGTKATAQRGKDAMAMGGEGVRIMEGKSLIYCTSRSCWLLPNHGIFFFNFAAEGKQTKGEVRNDNVWVCAKFQFQFEGTRGLSANYKVHRLLWGHLMRRVCVQIDWAGGAGGENEENASVLAQPFYFIDIVIKESLMKLPAHYSLRSCARVRHRGSSIPANHPDTVATCV